MCDYAARTAAGSVSLEGSKHSPRSFCASLESSLAPKGVCDAASPDAGSSVQGASAAADPVNVGCGWGLGCAGWRSWGQARSIQTTAQDSIGSAGDLQE
jgi:hypothetical protein